jgi:hypothetical protein
MELVGILERVSNLWTIKRVEGFTMKYDEAEKIYYKNVTRLPRTWSEAKRDADYACWIEVPKREWEDALEFGLGMLFMLPFLGISFYLLWVVLGM